jgi:hypothetical protein
MENNGAGIIDNTLLETNRVLLTTGIPMTYATSSTASYVARTYSQFQSPYAACDGVGNLWQVLNQGKTTGSYDSNAQTVIRVAPSYAGCGGTAGVPLWSAPQVLLKSTDTTLCGGTNHPDLRNYSMAFIPHDGNGTLVLFWMQLCPGRFKQAQYAYVDNPDPNNPVSNWSNVSAAPQTGIPGLPLDAVPRDQSGNYYNIGVYGHAMYNQGNGKYYVVVTGATTKYPCCTNDWQYWYSTCDNGHTWGQSGCTDSVKRVKSNIGTIHNLMPENESSGVSFSSDGNKVLMATRIDDIYCADGIGNVCPYMWCYTTNFISGGSSPTWTCTASNNFPMLGGRIDRLIGPSMQMVTVGSTTSAWLMYYERNSLTLAGGHLASIFIDPDALIANLNGYAWPTPQYIYLETTSQDLGGYPQCVIGGNSSWSCWWHDFNYTAGGSPLQVFFIHGSFVAPPATTHMKR